jgi:hypothetical protein
MSSLVENEIRNNIPIILRGELDLHSAFTWEKALREGVDAHFNCIVSDLSSPPNVSIQPASKYWILTAQTDLPTGYLTCPSSISGLSLYSKRAFNYGQISVKTKLPNMTGYPSNAWIFFGFESGWAAGTGIAAFKWDAFNRLWALLATPFWYKQRLVDVTSMLPTDYQTNYHIYTVKLNKNMAVFYIDNMVVAYSLITPNSFINAISPPPYGLFSIETDIASSQLALIEIGGRGMTLNLDLPYYNVRVNDGDPLPPQVIKLYQAGTNTLLANLSISSGSVSSHPIPTFGYGKKTLYFMADQSGTLLIEVLTQTNNWRTYDSVSVLASTLKIYPMAGDAVLARLTFTPSTYPATINEAEAVLS